MGIFSLRGIFAEPQEDILPLSTDSQFHDVIDGLGTQQQQQQQHEQQQEHEDHQDHEERHQQQQQQQQSQLRQPEFQVEQQQF